MTQERWTAVDAYFADLLVPADPDLDAVLAASDAAGLPQIQVSALQGKLLHLIARIQGARRVLEVGTLGGYSTVWLARAVPAGGQVVTLESDPRHAEVARANLAAAGVADRVQVLEGAAADSLSRLAAEQADPFDLVFLDADKKSNPEYLAWALRLTRPGSVIVADNVVRDGAVTDPASADLGTHGIRRFTELMAAEPRLTATAVQTVGTKGWDGFAVALVTAGTA